MRRRILLCCAILALSLADHVLAAGGANVIFNGSTPGPTPFISQLDLVVSPPDAVKSIEFMVEPKPNSVTRPVSASYSAAYLKGRGYLNTNTGQITLPVFGLYANYGNSVVLVYDFTQGPSQRDTVVIQTAAFADPTGGAYTNPTIVQPRSTSLDLSYDFVMLKGFAAPISPVIVDTDGEVRWIGTAGIASIPAIFFDNGIYVSSGTGIARMELDGTFQVLADYAGLGVTNAHHNYDPGKNGILIEVDTTSGIESTVMEVDGAGAVLKTWKLADIVSAAMIAGGDNPSAFVRPAEDWFHNNACAYRRSGDTLIVSGREDFVIGIDYDSGAVKWILGDTTKAWYQYPSLRKYALTLQKNSLPPIGEHALSIVQGGELLLFDNGQLSLNQSPAGADRNYSAPRKYRIHDHNMTAVETWHYLATPAIDSPYCSSIYEDGGRDYLIDYTLAGDLMGLTAKEEKVFQYRYSAAFFCGVSWNAIPIHLENVVYR